jgi:hypothetical protein
MHISDADFNPNKLHYHKKLSGVRIIKTQGKMSVLSLPKEYHGITTEVKVPTSIIKTNGEDIWIHAEIFKNILQNLDD